LDIGDRDICVACDPAVIAPATNFFVVSKNIYDRAAHLRFKSFFVGKAIVRIETRNVQLGSVNAKF
jgi:hypothetical protein